MKINEEYGHMDPYKEAGLVLMQMQIFRYCFSLSVTRIATTQAETEVSSRGKKSSPAFSMSAQGLREPGLCPASPVNWCLAALKKKRHPALPLQSLNLSIFWHEVKSMCAILASTKTEAIAWCLLSKGTDGTSTGHGFLWPCCFQKTGISACPQLLWRDFCPGGWVVGSCGGLLNNWKVDNSINSRRVFRRQISVRCPWSLDSHFVTW